MKNLKYFLVFGILVSGLMGCSNLFPSGTEQTKEVTKPQDGSLRVLINESMLTIKVVKDNEIPVKGSLNVKEGGLSLEGETPTFTFVTPFRSWDSGLVLRDERVTQIFFGLADGDSGDVKVSAVSLPQNLKEQLKQKTDFEFTTPLQIEWKSVQIKADAELMVHFMKDDKIEVISKNPVIVSIQSLGLQAELKKLMQACGHKAIDDKVEVSAHLVLTK